MNNFILGTAQLINNYGITNSTKNSKLEYEKILSYAFKNNYKFIDTAKDYNSEKAIGDFIKKNNYKSNIITKIPKFYDKSLSKSEKISFIKKNIENSINLLGQENCFGIIVHDINDFKNFEDEFLKILVSYKNKIFKKIGISIYDPQDLKLLNVYEDLNICQFPLNILDHRWYEALNINKLKVNNKFLYARSVFLQGLLLNFNTLWPIISLNEKKILKNTLNKICLNMNYSSIIELCISYVISYPQIENITLGIANLKNFKECNEVFYNCKKMSQNDIENIHNLMPELHNNFLNPQKWNK